MLRHRSPGLRSDRACFSGLTTTPYAAGAAQEWYRSTAGRSPASVHVSLGVLAGTCRVWCPGAQHPLCDACRAVVTSWDGNAIRAEPERPDGRLRRPAAVDRRGAVPNRLSAGPIRAVTVVMGGNPVTQACVTAGMCGFPKRRDCVGCVRCSHAVAGAGQRWCPRRDPSAHRPAALRPATGRTTSAVVVAGDVCPATPGRSSRRVRVL